jgi:hypothetical protein
LQSVKAREKKMKINGFWLKVLAFSLLVLAVPMTASAQWKNDDDDDDYYNRSNRNDNYRRNYNRQLEQSIKRIHKDSDRFKDYVEDAFDNDRYDDRRNNRWGNSNRRLLDAVDRFDEAAQDLENKFDRGRNLNRSSNEARDLISAANEINRMLNNNRFYDNRVKNMWNQFQSDLKVIADAYNLRYGNTRRFPFPRNDNGNGTWPF